MWNTPLKSFEWDVILRCSILVPFVMSHPVSCRWQTCVMRWIWGTMFSSLVVYFEPKQIKNTWAQERNIFYSQLSFSFFCSRLSEFHCGRRIAMTSPLHQILHFIREKVVCSRAVKLYFLTVRCKQWSVLFK